MVPARSDKVSRVSSYSGYRYVNLHFAYGALTLFGWLSQNHSAMLVESRMRSEPGHARTTVWPLPRSLAATYGIDVSFSSSPYLDVSVQAVPLRTLWIHVRMTGATCRVSPFRNLRVIWIFAPNRSLSQLITSFIGS